MAAFKRVLCGGTVFLLLHLIIWELTSFSSSSVLLNRLKTCSGIAVGCELSMNRVICQLKKYDTNGRRHSDHLSSPAVLLKVIKLTKMVLVGSIIIQCNDVSINPGPVAKTTCPQCLKSIRRNQGRLICASCKLTYHLKCLHVDFDKSNKCQQCYVSVIDVSNNMDDDEVDYQLPQELITTLHTRGLKIAHLNIRSLRGKLDELNVLISHCRNIDIIVLNETWLNEEILDSKVEIRGYSLYRNDRVNRSGGGVAIYVRDNIITLRRTDLESIAMENLWIEVNIPKSKSILIGTYYRPPNQSLDFMESFKENMERAVCENKELLITGDFNCDMATTRPSSEAKKLKRLLRSFQLTQLIDRPTRVTDSSSTLLDLVVSSAPYNIVKRTVIPLSLSDHDLVVCVRKINTIKSAPKLVECRNYRNYSTDAFCSDLKKIHWDMVMNESQVDTAWLCFKDHFIGICNQHAPVITRKMKGTHFPWLTNEIKTMMRERDYFLKKARATNDEKFWKAYKSMRNKINGKIRSEKTNYNRKLIQENAKDPKALWNAINKIIPNNRKSSVITHIKHGENMVSDKQSIADIFNTYFCSIVKNISQFSDTLNTANQHIFSSGSIPVAPLTNVTFDLNPVTESFVYSQLRKLKISKANGLDCIPNRLLIDGASHICSSLTHIINLSISTGVFPSEWKTAKVIPLFKSGNKTDMDNYRPISILPAVSKIIERAVYQQLYQHLDKHNLLCPFQSGFRKNFSTQTAVTLFTDTIRRNMDLGLLTGAIYIDLKKAFDTIDHQLLLQKLCCYGLSDQAQKWFCSYLNKRNQRVQINNILSSIAEMHSGVPQGSILGPLLFIMYINDLPSCVYYSKVMLYADDTVIYFAAKTTSDLEIFLNLDLNNISVWMEKNNLFLNLTKTEYVIYGTYQNPKIHDDIIITYNGIPLKRSVVFKYLGVFIDQSLSFNDHINHIIIKVSKRLGLIGRFRKSISINVAKQLYNTMILPLFDYCDVVWQGCGKVNADALERIQRRAARLILPLVGFETDNLMESLHLVPLLTRRNVHSAIFARKCLEGLVPSYLVDYFKLKQSVHSYATRNADTNIYLPKVKLEIAKRSFYYSGAIAYNSLPKELKSKKSFLAFEHYIKECFL